MTSFRPRGDMPGSRANPGSKNGPGPSLLDLNWEVFGELCRALALKIAGSGYEPELVLGIAKGGVIPGAVIASMLRCDFFSMKISRREGLSLVSEEPQVLTAAPRQAEGKRVLVVDEICSSGATMRLALAAARHVGPSDVRTAATFLKQGGYRPDYYALEADATVVFPWDREVVEPTGELGLNPLYRTLLT